MKNNVIRVQNLVRSFTQYKKEAGLSGTIKSFFKRESFEIKAVENINFEIQEGEKVGFIGPNGAGKTTTLKMLSGILYPSSGEIDVLGFTPIQRKKEFLKSIGLVLGQRSQLWWDLPPKESFLLNKEIYEIDTKEFNETLEELSEMLDVKDILDIPVRKLSLGQRMKCELIAAIIHKPKVIFLDEPTIGLDVVVQKKIREFFKTYNEKNKATLILTSHYMDDVKEICERLIIINKGKLIYDGSLEELINKFAKDKYLKFIFNEKVDKSELAALGKIVEYNAGGLAATLAVKREEHAKVAAEILTRYSVDDLDVSEIELEDIITKIFAK